MEHLVFAQFDIMIDVFVKASFWIPSLALDEFNSLIVRYYARMCLSSDLHVLPDYVINYATVIMCRQFARMSSNGLDPLLLTHINWNSCMD